MQPKLLMTAGYPELVHMIRKVSKELQIDVTIIEGILDEAAEKVKRHIENSSYEVVISRAGSAQAIRRVVDLPVVNHDSDQFDILQGFIRAKKLGERVCFITYPEEGFFFNFKDMIDVIGHDITILPYKTTAELKNQIKKAKDMGIDVVLGGGIRAAAEAKKYGMKSMYLTASERTIKRSLLLANKVAEDRILLKEKAERHNAVINASEEGILFINAFQEIESCNPAAEKLLGIKAETILGKKVYDYKTTTLFQLIGNSEIYNSSGNFTKMNMNITYEPVLVENVRIGTVITCREVSKIQNLENKIRRELHLKGFIARHTFNEITHKCKKMKDIVELASEYSHTDSTVLIIGESGTGKELFAQSIHNASKRKDRPFVAVNCAALPESILESELFGYAEGAFTGANKGGRQGLFELAHNGTIFLDEIGEIPSHIQTRLLRVLQEKVVMRIGGDRVVPINIRIIAATNQRLWGLVKEGKFRLDLYFRLSVLHLDIPPLRQRSEDIPELVDVLISKSERGGFTFNSLSEPLQKFFMSYHWPGNIRQLENIIERLMLRLDNEKFLPRDFINEVYLETESEKELFHSQGELIVNVSTMESMEQQIIKSMLERYNQNRTLVAEKLGISRTTIWKKLSE
ncbi:sigma 54-interacting transcriptional regulator [Cytobacillus kochii]|uniref:sigma 54-interacting transcriptional regulator n=1 Tax=Cytobacillus kochii TaxID=859143 RepID=UPI00277EC8AD|nr:sigma 54-interacting transcriptional regulator [Cytobacillus kochii]MDQ0185338.1 transcriptional regulator with PAS, ATPase and Fis domain [Cytobacillus kochii]